MMMAVFVYIASFAGFRPNGAAPYSNTRCCHLTFQGPLYTVTMTAWQLKDSGLTLQDLD